MVKFIYSEKATKFCEISTLRLAGTKGQIKPKLDWPAVDCPKKRTDDLFATKSKKANKSNLSVCFLGEVSRPKIAFDINLYKGKSCVAFS